jgi:hypothetical protein
MLIIDVYLHLKDFILGSYIRFITKKQDEQERDLWIYADRSTREKKLGIRETNVFVFFF